MMALVYVQYVLIIVSIKNNANNTLVFQVPDLDAILVPISGGGMTSGIAVTAQGMQPACRGVWLTPPGFTFFWV